eukprot:TRINITY_DN6019_c0_g2_i9.p1 TRINITY_DN6019_c0_g2~~TRINITY_DN6019_c0_g2_i9.p1  ORF type:complete len:128 (-),score=33.92 TRINITY_DN6019_c0_g2_i9:116-499(-)
MCIRDRYMGFVLIMDKELEMDKPTELTIMNNLFNHFLTESAYNVFIGSLIGLTCGALLKRPRIGFFMGVGFSFGRTMSKYNSLFDEVRVTKMPPHIMPFYTTNYFMEKLSKAKARVLEKLHSRKPNP